MQVFLITWLCFNLGSSLKFKNTVSYPRSYFVMYSINISCQKQNIFACRKLNPSLSDPKGYSGPLFSFTTQFPFLSPSLNGFACQQTQQLGMNCRTPMLILHLISLYTNLPAGWGLFQWLERPPQLSFSTVTEYFVHCVKKYCCDWCNKK